VSVVDDLSTLTGERVYKVRSGYLIVVTNPQSSVIVRSDTAYRIRDKTVQDLPLGFQATGDGCISTGP